MASYHQQMQAIFKQYQEEVSAEPVDLRIVGAWAMTKGLWAPRPIDIQSRFAAEMAEALREEYRTDKSGRRYRSKLAVTTSKDGRQGSLWGDIDTAPRSHVVKNVGQRRRQTVHDCLQLRIDVDHYNAEHPDEDDIQLVLDFTDDVEELLVAASSKDDGNEAA
jgi:hypothetical protein